MKTDLTINATSAVDGKKVTNKITYVNPNISTSQAISLASAINALTTDSYSSTTRTDTTTLDTPKANPVTKAIWLSTSSTWSELNVNNPSISADWTPETFPYSTATPTLPLRVQMPNNGSAPIIINNNSTMNISKMTIDYPYTNPSNSWDIKIYFTLAVGTLDFTIHFNETNDYAAVDIPVHITYTEE